MISSAPLRIGLLCLLAAAASSPLARAVAPAAPSNCVATALSATASAASIVLNWNDNSTNETQWKIQVSIGTGAYSDFAAIASTTTATTGSVSVTWSGASLNTAYHFKIIASNGSEFSVPSNIATVGTFDLGSPINLNVTAVDPFNVAMSWEEGSTGETGFAIERKEGSGAWEYLGTLGANSLSLNPSNLTSPLGTFAFRIRAYKGSPPTTPDSPSDANTSVYSNISSVATGAYTLAAGKATGKPVINLTWPGVLNATGYQIILKETAATAYSIVSEVAANVTTYQILAPSISPGTSYSIIVRPFAGTSSTGIMGESGVAAIAVDAYALAAAALPGQAAVNLSWVDLPNETGYGIYYKAAGDASYSLLHEVTANVTSYQATAPQMQSAGSYSFIIQANNGNGALCESSVASVTLDGITSKSGASGSPGDWFAHTFTDNVTRSAVSSRTLTGTPATLSFNSSTGDLSGALPAAGNYTLNYTVTFLDGTQLTQALCIRVRPAAGAPLVGSLIAAWSGLAGASRDTPLAGTFSAPEADSAVRVSTTLGTMDCILFNTATPATVANFMSYVVAGQYTDVAFHRSVAGFVIQGGGFKGAGSGNHFTSVVTRPPVINEPGIANQRGTLSMAKTGGDPNSATSQFFVSLGDNTANLDYQNGGFTVFGRVAGNGMAVADAISVLPTATYNLLLDGNTSATPFADFPMNAASPPASMDQTQVVKIISVTPIPTLSYSITGNTNPAVAAASIIGGQLHLTGLTGGHTTITVSATNLDNLSTSQSVTVTISDYTTWAASLTNPPLSNTAPNADPDHDGLANLLEYVLGSDPRVPNTGGPALSVNGGNLKFTFKRKDSSQTSDVSLRVEVSTDMLHWTSGYNIGADTASSSAGVEVVQNGAADDLITVTIPKGSDAHKFVRLAATTTHDAAVTSDTYATWAARTSFPNNQSGPGQDPDGDSLTNLQEYAFMGDPALASQAPLPVAGKTGVAPAAQFLTLRFALRKFTTGLSYVVEASNQLGGTWTPVWNSAADPGFSQTQVLSAVDQSDRTLVTLKDNVALGTQARRFMRVRVTQE
ncbi:MAG: peptidylprolyl isomerase [Verrucomicrobiota bacterium]